MCECIQGVDGEEKHLHHSLTAIHFEHLTAPDSAVTQLQVHDLCKHGFLRAPRIPIRSMTQVDQYLPDSNYTLKFLDWNIQALEL